MIETAHIDIKAVIEQLCCIAWTGKQGQGQKSAYKGGPCPFCHVGTDRFAVFPEGEKPHFYCGIHGNGCGAHGDVIAFVQQIKGYTTAGQAIRELREMGYPVGDETIAPGYKPSSERDRPGQKWQDRGNALIHAAQKCLWSSKGKQALDYLRKRGLQDETIKRFRIGYCPDWSECQFAEWGIEGEGVFWLRPSILIPCYESYEKDVLWGINRRIPTYTEKELERQRQGERLPPRYMQIKGSSNGLFNVESIRPGEPLFMTEGEIDAMTLGQEASYAVVATGSTKGAQLSRWVASISLASHLIIAFDDDEGKGEKAAEYWTDLFEDKATFYPPWSKDVNEMLQQGQDIKLWASMGVEITVPSSDQSSPIPVANTHETPATLPLVTPCVSDGIEEPRGTKKNQEETCLTEHLSTTAESEVGENLAVSRGFSRLDTLAPLPSSDAPDVIPELADTCTVCGGEVVWYSDDQRPWCADHSPIDAPQEENKTLTRDEIVQRFKDALPGWSVELLDTGEWDRQKAERIRHYREQDQKRWIKTPGDRTPDEVWWSIPRSNNWGKFVASDYWTGLEARLALKGYDRAFKATEEALLHRVSTPRVYLCPVPRYELRADDQGVMHLVTVGYWAGQSQEVSA
jgi:hypothetical protein